MTDALIRFRDKIYVSDNNELLLTYAKANQVKDFHVPPGHRLG